VQKGTDLVRQMFLPPVGARQAVMTMAGPAVQSMLAKDSFPAQAKAEIETLIAAAGDGDLVSVSYALDERVRGRASELLAQARALREGRTASASSRERTERAAKLEDEAASLLADDV
jgi:hypothetical protein